MSGLPPPARGARVRSYGTEPVYRSTPACAGSTPLRWWPCSPHSVYPRLRGEHDFAIWRVPYRAGLPPPARGARIPQAPPGASSRSTPACAGSTASAESVRQTAQVYPRLRGEHVVG